MTGPLPSVRNKYGGVYVDSANLPEDAADFTRRLQASLAAWEAADIPVAWLQIPGRLGGLLAPALAQGFECHHCSGDAVMLVRRIRPEAYVPTAATHSIGVGGVVINEARELLVVLERRDLKARPGHFKLPGGMLEPGEHLVDGVVREVREETGIETGFDGLVSMRHHHQGQFGASNIYAVCSLRPCTLRITRDDSEIARAHWIPVDEYLDDPRIGLYNRRVVRAALEGRPLNSIKLDGYMTRPADYEIFVPADGA